MTSERTCALRKFCSFDLAHRQWGFNIETFPKNYLPCKILQRQLTSCHNVKKLFFQISFRTFLIGLCNAAKGKEDGQRSDRGAAAAGG